MRNKSFTELTNSNPALCFYIDLVSFQLQREELENDISKNVENIIEENIIIKETANAIKKWAEHVSLRSTSEFLASASFSDRFFIPIKKQFNISVYRENGDGITLYKKSLNKK